MRRPIALGGVLVLAACTGRSPYYVGTPLLATCVESLVPASEAGLTLMIDSPEPCATDHRS